MHTKKAYSDNKGLILLTVLFIVALSFLPSLNNGFTNWDDHIHLLENDDVWSLSIENVGRIFKHTVNKTYIPLTTLSFALEYHFFGYNPVIYHLDNLLLHLGVVALVFFFAQSCGASVFAAGLAGLLFGVHPMNVESVAWVTERKDVLYAFFYMAALYAYCNYLKNIKIQSYGWALLWGFLSILAKPMALSLPFIFLACDWLYKRRFEAKALLDKIPFLFYIIPIVWITYSPYARIPGKSLPEAFLIWVWTAAFYIRKFFLPLDLVPLYQLPQPVSILNFEYLLAVLVLVLILALLVRFRTNRLFVFAWLFYIGSIFFLLRFDDVADRSIVADRFMYLPKLGLCLWLGCVCEGVLRGVQQQKGLFRQAVIAGLALVFVGLAVKTSQQSGIWRNSITLWTHVIESSPGVAEAYNNRGLAYNEEGKQTLSLADYNKALMIDPGYIDAYNNRGVLYKNNGQFDRALIDFNKVLDIDPNLAEAYFNRAKVYRHLGRGDLALADFNQSLAIRPGFAEAHNSRGVVYLGDGQYDLALADFDRAIEARPGYAKAYNNRGTLYAMLDQLVKAIDDFDQAISYDANYYPAYYNRSLAYRKLGRSEEALRDALKAKALGMQRADSYIADLKQKISPAF